jgi:hypothetical protein
LLMTRCRSSPEGNDCRLLNGMCGLKSRHSRASDFRNTPFAMILRGIRLPQLIVLKRKSPLFGVQKGCERSDSVFRRRSGGLSAFLWQSNFWWAAGILHTYNRRQGLPGDRCSSVGKPKPETNSEGNDGRGRLQLERLRQHKKIEYRTSPQFPIIKAILTLISA